MPTSSQLEEISKDDGSKIEKLHVEFTNGSLEQLRELADFFQVRGDVSEVVKLGISFLQNVKDRSEIKTVKDEPEAKEK